MSQKQKLVAELLSRSRQDWHFDELRIIVEEFGYVQVSDKGSHRTFKHPKDPKLLTLKESGSGAELRCYARDVRKRIESLIAMKS